MNEFQWKKSFGGSDDQLMRKISKLPPFTFTCILSGKINASCLTVHTYKTETLL